MKLAVFLLALACVTLEPSLACNRFRVGRATVGVEGPGEAGGSGLYVGVRVTIPFKRRRRSTKDIQDHDDVFNACDVNKDNALTLKEFKHCLPQPASVLSRVFSKLDSNNDGVLTREEFASATVNLGDRDPKGNCYTKLLGRCGATYLLYLRSRDDTDATNCDAIQEYAKCVGNGAKACDDDQVKQYVTMLSGILQTSKQGGVCPELDLSGLAKSTSESENSSEEELPCSKQAVTFCDVSLFEDLHDSAGLDACNALDAYAKCLERATLDCDDQHAKKTINAAEGLLKAYAASGLCE